MLTCSCADAANEGPVGGCRFHVRVFASAHPWTHTPVLLVHARGSSSERYLPIATRLSEHFDVYAPDLPGHGASDAPPHALGVQGFAHWLGNWMRAMELPRAFIVSHASGCEIAVELALSEGHLADRLVLIAPPQERASQLLRRRLLPKWATSGAAASARRLEDRMPHVGVPVMFVRGEWDTRVPQSWIDELAARTPNSRVAVIVAAAQVLRRGSTNGVAYALESFLSEGRIARH